MRTDPDTVDISILNVAITEDDINKDKGKLCLTFTSCISQEKTSVVKMPHLQTLADKGVVFMDAHSSPKCAPSRYMMLSGNYPHRGSNIYGTSKLKQDHSQFTTFQKSIAELLREEARYDTAVFGKVSFLHRYLLLNFN